MLLRPSELVLDAKNVKLLRLLRDDPRLGIAELARAIGMSAPAVRERLQAGFGVRTRIMPTEAMTGALRRYDRHRKVTSLLAGFRVQQEIH